MKSHEQIPFTTALKRIGLSVVVVNGIALLFIFCYFYIQNWRSQNNKYNIQAIIQTGPEKEALKTVYLAELLNLSSDSPTNLYKFNIQTAQEKLLESPLIKKASIKKLFPSTLFIDYTARKPVAFLSDYTNTALDVEGYLFPFHPFFRPKKLPEIYLGLIAQDGDPQLEWGEALKGPKAELAFELLHFLNQECCSSISHLRKIDVSNAFAESYAQKEIIISLEDVWEKECEGRQVLCVVPRIIRLNTKNYKKEIHDYLILRSFLLNQEVQQAIDNTQPVVKLAPMIIDMRIAHLAYFKEENL